MDTGGQVTNAFRLSWVSRPNGWSGRMAPRASSYQCLSAESGFPARKRSFTRSWLASHQCLSAECGSPRTPQCPTLWPRLRRHQCLSAESGFPAMQTRPLSEILTLSPMPFGGGRFPHATDFALAGSAVRFLDLPNSIAAAVIPPGGTRGWFVVPSSTADYGLTGWSRGGARARGGQGF